MSRYVCEPSQPHESSSTPGQEHVDYQHKVHHDNGHVEYAGRCSGEGTQHITEPSLVGQVWEFFGGKK